MHQKGPSIIRKVVIPAAGYGTRFLPATKAMPKEMLPIVDKPIIQYVVEEAVKAGIEDVIIVTGWHKRSIEDHFDEPFELAERLKKAGKKKELKEVQRIANLANFIYIRQKGPNGNATPIANAREVVGDEPFLVMWGDEFVIAEPKPHIEQLVEAYQRFQGTILSAVRKTDAASARRYGFAAGDVIEPGVIRVDRLVEKPGPSKRPSDLAIVTGSIFTPDFFTAMERIKPKEGQEFVYIDVLNELLKEHPVYAVEIKGSHYYDTGNKLEYIKANLDFALRRPDLAKDLRDYMRRILKSGKS